MRTPDFFIIGAPKCGTTALAHYLAQHPDVCFSNPKEPHYFCDDFLNIRKFNDYNHYMTSFNQCKERKLYGEGSVWYLYSKVALTNIKKINPNAKIIVMIRNPIDFVQSLHNQQLFSGNEDLESFEDAWNLQEERKKGHNIPKNCYDPIQISYSETGLFSKYLNILYNEFNSENILLLTQEELLADTKHTYTKTLKFLKIKEVENINFDKINQNRVVKNKLLKRIIQSRPKVINKVIQKVKKLFGISSLGILRKIDDINSKQVSRKKISNKTQDILKDYFMKEIKQLKTRYGIDYGMGI